MSTERGRPIAIDTSLVECVVVVVPGTGLLVEIAAALAELVADGQIRILDLVAVVRSPSSGEISTIGPECSDGAPLCALVDEQIGKLLSEKDIDSAVAALLPGSAAILVLIEDRWANTLSSAAVRAGGRVVGGVRVPEARIEAALHASPAMPINPDLMSPQTDDRG